jgi:hypothetical protein
MFIEKKHLFLIFLSIFFQFSPVYGSYSFLKPLGWVQEPRLERPFLGSIDCVGEYIKATQSYNDTGKQVPLMEIYNIPDTPNISHEGIFRGTTVSCRLTQNFDKGFFVSGSFIYLWFSLQAASPFILAKTQRSVGIGDIIATLGWTYSYQETEELDFIDLTFQAGGLIPTAQRSATQLFSLPLGNSGHPGFIINGVAGWGAFEWLTIGCGMTALFSGAKAQSIIIKEHNSDILLKNSAIAHPGTFLAIESFVKADHFIRGLSFGVGYSYCKQSKTRYTKSQALAQSIIISTDPSSRKSFQHALHLYTEYDFTKNGWTFGPRIGLTYNFVVGGKNCFKTAFIQGTWGLDIAMDC